MAFHYPHQTRFRQYGQRGIATLAIGIILLILITLVSLYGMRVTILEQRVSANDYRSHEAYGAAQAGLSYGMELAKGNEGLLRSTSTNGWLASANAGWTTSGGSGGNGTVLLDCSQSNLDAWPNSITAAACNSGFKDGSRIRTYALPDSGGNKTPPGDHDPPNFVSAGWPASGSGSFADCPGADCRVSVALVLCEFGKVGDPCEDAGGLSSQYAVLVLARGESADGTAQASVRQMLAPYDVFPGSALPPLMAASNVEISGTLDVVVNPDGAGDGTGVPISGWSNDDLVMSGTASFCYPDEYFQGSGADLTSMPACDADLGNQPCSVVVNGGSGSSCEIPVCANCGCPTSAGGALTRNDGSNYVEGIDVVDIDNNNGPTPDSVSSFPSDVFNYIFGIAHDDYELIKNDPATQLESDCGGINAESSGLYWITGDCTINGNGGSPSEPLIIVTEGDFAMAGNATYFGLAFAFSPQPASANSSVTMNGGAEFYGTFVSDHQVDFGGGNFDLIYSKCLFDHLASDDKFKRLGPVPGSWADHI